MRGCRKGDSCYFSHEHPNSIPLCPNRLNCGYGRSCKFRHATIVNRMNGNKTADQNLGKNIASTTQAQPSASKTLLDEIPDAITKVIFDMKLEMECHELSERLNDTFHEQFEWLVIHDRNLHATDREIGDGLHHRDCEDKISKKYSQTRSRVLNNFVYPFIKQFKFVSTSDPGVTFTDDEDKLVMDRDECDMMVMELEDSTSIDREMMKKMKLEIISMPYEYVKGCMKVNGELLLTFTFSESPIFETMEEHLISIGYEYDGYFTEDEDECFDHYGFVPFSEWYYDYSESDSECMCDTNIQ